MKSREYAHKASGVIYWLEDDKVMMRKPGCDGIVKRSVITAAKFLELIDGDALVMVGESVTVKTKHFDKYGDVMAIYRNVRDGNLIFIDGILDDPDSSPSWRGIYTPLRAREIASRLNHLADLIEGK
ncbi:hypothetical protein CSP48_004020 [Salmonella enterica subsp. arizonae]|nr:hypothetical protein [Salmonella enterica subsp. arizonae]